MRIISFGSRTCRLCCIPFRIVFRRDFSRFLCVFCNIVFCCFCCKCRIRFRSSLAVQCKLCRGIVLCSDLRSKQMFLF